jgi:DNA transformation protein
VPTSTPALVEHSLELLSGLGPMRARRMFGGWGLYAGAVMVGLIAFDRLYLKVDANTRSRFEQAGCEPFVYTGQSQPVTMSYWTVPDEAMESAAEMQPWARLALQAALAAAVAKVPKVPKAPKATKPAAGKAARPRRRSTPVG